MDEKMILERLDRIEHLLTIIATNTGKQSKPKGQVTKIWVSAAFVKSLTGWDNNKMRQMRRYDLIVYKTINKKTIRYLLESIPEQFINQE